MHAAMHLRIDMLILGFFAAFMATSLFSARGMMRACPRHAHVIPVTMSRTMYPN